MINKIIASKITPSQIFFICPECRTKYKKDDTPYSTSKPVIHIHGNETGTPDNRETSRSHHVCWNYPRDKEHTSNFCIVIDNSTERVGF